MFSSVASDLFKDDAAETHCFMADYLLAVGVQVVGLFVR